MGARCRATEHRTYWGTSLDRVFCHSDYQRDEVSSFNSDFNSENYLQVKIIKEVSPTEYIVADATGFRQIDLDKKIFDLNNIDISSEIYWRQNKMLLKENNYVKIKGYGIDFQSEKVILKQKTIITKIEEFPVDQTKPASNRRFTFGEYFKFTGFLLLASFMGYVIYQGSKDARNRKNKWNSGLEVNFALKVTFEG